MYSKETATHPPHTHTETHTHTYTATHTHTETQTHTHPLVSALNNFLPTLHTCLNIRADKGIAFGWHRPS